MLRQPGGPAETRPKVVIGAIASALSIVTAVLAFYEGVADTGVGSLQTRSTAWPSLVRRLPPLLPC